MKPWATGGSALAHDKANWGFPYAIITSSISTWFLNLKKKEYIFFSPVDLNIKDGKRVEGRHLSVHCFSTKYFTICVWTKYQLINYITCTHTWYKLSAVRTQTSSLNMIIIYVHYILTYEICPNFLHTGMAIHPIQKDTDTRTHRHPGIRHTHTHTLAFRWI